MTQVSSGLAYRLILFWFVQMEGDFNIDEGGNVYFKEEDGMDYAAVTVQLPGGERVPFLFTVKELEAKVPRAGTLGLLNLQAP